MNRIAKFAQFRRSTVTGRYRVLKSPEYEPRMTSETKQKRSSKRLLVIACLALVAFIAIGVLVSTNNPAKNQSSGLGGALQPPSNNPLAVTQAHMVLNSGSGATLFIITLKNTGSEPVTSLTVKLGGEQAQSALYNGEPISMLNPLPYNSTASLSLASGPGGLSQRYNTGQSYTVTLSGQLTFGTRFSFTTSVVAESK